MTAQAKYEVGSPVRATRPSAFGYVYEDGVVESISRLGGGNRVLHIEFADGHVGRFHSDYITKFVTLRDTSSEDRRNDPARKAAIAEIIATRQAAWAEALVHLAAAEAALLSVGSMADDALMGRSHKALRIAGSTIRRDAELFMREHNDCYLGNKAAEGHPIGWKP